MTTPHPPTLPLRAGTPIEGPQTDGAMRVVDGQGREVSLSPEQHRLWLLLDGTRGIDALASALGCAKQRVWDGLDGLADVGLLTRRAAPPAGGAVSRRRWLSRGIPLVAMAVPGATMAQSLGELSNKFAEGNAKNSESITKAGSAEAAQKASSEQSGKNLAESASKSINANLGEERTKQNEALAKAFSPESLEKAGQEQNLKQGEVANKAGQGGNNAVPEPTTLALLGIAGVAVYAQHRLRAREQRGAEQASNPEAND